VRKDEKTIVHDDSVTPDEAVPVEETHPSLLLLSGIEAGRTFRLEEGDNLVGRSEDARVMLGDDGVSRKHALIQVAGGRITVKDLRSTNGTRRNGHPLVAGGEELEEGDVLLFGHTLAARFLVQDPVVENLQRKLFDAAVQDPLTGAYNKRYLIERFEQEFAFAERHKRPLSVLIYDIDHFKTINDTLGHQTGDQVLCEIANFVGGRIRKEDLHARWGGEEFVVLMRETRLENAAILAERLLQGIRALRFEGPEGPFTIAVSIGITSSSLEKFASSMELFIRADKMLYKAKELGRDRIVCDGSVPESSREAAADDPTENS
jgi:two-component system, cell cycle response regulator